MFRLDHRVQTALIERMIGQLVARIFAVTPDRDIHGLRSEGVKPVFVTFKAPGSTRFAAWLELTIEWRRGGQRAERRKGGA
ncbi:MAG: hypothetical protein KGS44_08390 [Alphaproteobacteria bacterium]|nr:hypothetical protein [Alphaproteobacteria bacterium]